MSHPPKPQLTLRIGVTGHRPGMQLPTESFARVRSQVQDVLKNASGVLAKAHQQFQAKYSSASTQVRIISSLAEGADRIVAEVALAFGFGLEVILPFDRAAYEADFSGEESRREFGELLKHASAIFEIEDEKALIARDHAYVAAGEELLAQCDLLLAIWDGAAGRGKGGTAEVLSAARRLGVPYVWIHAARDCEPKVSGRYAESRHSSGEREHANWSAHLETEILHLVSPPGDIESDDAVSRKSVRTVVARIERFFAEIEQRVTWALPYDLLRWMFAGRAPRLHWKMTKLCDRSYEWNGFLNALPVFGDLKNRISSVLLERYLWADHLANYYGNAYRSAYVTVFGLAGFTVLIGLASMFTEDTEIAKAILIGLEVALISVVLWLIHYGRKRGWHVRWLEYRQIAEALRHGRFLALTGRLTYGYSEDWLLSESTDQWTTWYVRATLRELGLPSLRADNTYVTSLVQAMIVNEIDPQIAFHFANARELSRLNHRLDRVGISLFLATFMVGVLFLCLMGFELIVQPGGAFESIFDALKPVEITLMAGLPAIGAAIAGIRAQGEFQTSADRSRLTATRLTALKAQLTGETLDPTFYRVSALLHAVGRTMATELDSWQFIYRHRPLALPS